MPPYVPPKLITASIRRGTYPEVMEPGDDPENPETPALYDTTDKATKTEKPEAGGDLPEADNAPVGLVDEEELSDPAAE